MSRNIFSYIEIADYLTHPPNENTLKDHPINIAFCPRGKTWHFTPRIHHIRCLSRYDNSFNIYKIIIMTPEEKELLKNWKQDLEKRVDKIIDEMGRYPGSLIDQHLLENSIQELLEAKDAQAAEMVRNAVEAERQKLK